MIKLRPDFQICLNFNIGTLQYSNVPEFCCKPSPTVPEPPATHLWLPPLWLRAWVWGQAVPRGWKQILNVDIAPLLIPQSTANTRMLLEVWEYCNRGIAKPQIRFRSGYFKCSIYSPLLPKRTLPWLPHPRSSLHSSQQENPPPSLIQPISGDSVNLRLTLILLCRAILLCPNCPLHYGSWSLLLPNQEHHSSIGKRVPKTKKQSPFKK